MGTAWKTVRVFISSTFRDMHAERDHLVKVVFPRLRERLLPRRVELVDVDLRWGITAAQAENRKVLSLCLEQVDECRPFFLGLIGQRYGWTPDGYPDDARAQFPWLAEHPGVSITELEMLHGALRDPGRPTRALFCLREDQALATVPQAARPAFVDAGPEGAAHLEGLRQRVAASGHPVRPYDCRWDDAAYDRPTRRKGRLAGLTEFGEQVERWLEEAVEAELGLTDPSAPLDPLHEEADFHERFLETRLRVYAGRAALNEQLHAFALAPGDAPALVTGPSGSGKSAALARFVDTFRRVHPDVLVLPHFVGASPWTTTLPGLLGRLCGELKRRFDFPLPVPDDAAGRVTAFLSFLAGVPADRRVVLVIDALDQLDGRGAEELAWLPMSLPDHVKVIVSCADGPGPPPAVLAAQTERGCRRLPLGPLTDRERRQVVRDAPRLWAKTLDDAQVDGLVSNAAAGNPLFLSVALEELRGFGSFERLGEVIAGLPSEGDAVAALFGQVFSRLEEEFGEEIVRAVLSLLGCARRGLSDAELRELTAGCRGAGELFVVLRQLRPYLLSRAGRWDFYHASTRRAVAARYLQGEAARTVRRQLVDYFRPRRLEGRGVEELPWQLAALGAWEELGSLLGDVPFFEAAWRADELEVREYWSQVEAASPLRMADAYRPVLDAPAAHPPDAVWRVAMLFQKTGRSDEALALQSHLVEHFRGAGDEGELVSSLINHAMLLYAKGDSDGAIRELDEVARACRRLNKAVPLATCLGNQALILANHGAVAEAMRMHEIEGELFRQIDDLPGLCRSLCNRGNLLYQQGDPAGAMRLYLQAEELCRRLNDLAGLSLLLGNQALILHDRGDLAGALRLHRQAEEISRRLNDSARLSDVLNNQALILQGQGEFDEALRLYREKEEICQRRGDPYGIISSRINQADVLRTRGRLDEALRLLEEQEESCRRLNYPAGLSTCLGNQALIRQTRGDLEGALRLHKEEEEICRRLGDPSKLQYCLGNQALVLRAWGDLDGALGLLKEQEEISRRLDAPAALATCLGNQAVIRLARGDPEGALRLHKEEEGLWRRLGSPSGLASSLGNQALVLRAWGDLDGALRLLKEQEEIGRRLGDRAVLAASTGNQALVRYGRGELEAALRLFREQEAISRELDDPANLALSLGNQALIMADRGDRAAARELHRREEEIYRRLNQPSGLQRSLGNQAVLLMTEGDLDGALRLLLRQEEICRRLDDPAGLHVCLGNQALIRRALGDAEGALRLHREEEEICRRLGNPGALASSLINQALLLAHDRGRAGEAVPLAEEARRLAERHGLTAMAERLAPVVEEIRRLGSPDPHEGADS